VLLDSDKKYFEDIYRYVKFDERNVIDLAYDVEHTVHQYKELLDEIRNCDIDDNTV
jgi:hypothetical protein